MTPRRNPTGLCGVLALDKPLHLSSHDVVEAIRRLTGERRVGHAGTLDPLATGLLLVCVGPATRLSEYLMRGQKTYEARICFGTATTTDDAEGSVIETSALPPEVGDARFATECLTSLVGKSEQIPPVFSAIKKRGVKAYEAARMGKTLECEPRSVQLFEAKLCAIGSDYWDLQLVVSKGFYVRAFARDMGKALGSAAHLGALRRTASGGLTLEQAFELLELKQREELPFINPAAALGLPIITVSATGEQRVKHGRTLSKNELIYSKAVAWQNPLQGDAAEQDLSEYDPLQQGGLAAEQKLFSIVYEERLLALYERDNSGDTLRPKVVIPGGIPLGLL